MKKILSLALLISTCFTSSAQYGSPTAALEGRWDLSYQHLGKTLPAWLEINHSGVKHLVGHFVGASGSARPISNIVYDKEQFQFSIPPQWERSDANLEVKGQVRYGSMTGTMRLPNGESVEFQGQRAPKLIPDKDPEWGPAQSLLNTKDLSGWETLGKENQWVNANGVLTSNRSGSNIKTSKSFKDFKLHVEFRYPEGSNSGIYLRGRYEVQVADSYRMDPQKDQIAAIYGFIQPLKNVCKPVGEWQSYDITLVGRVVTVVHNGVTVIYKQEIPGITGGALDSKEGEPGPLLIQGDHGPVEYRNIKIQEAK